jgi:polyribonucleotide nucleotidyltransferase
MKEIYHLPEPKNKGIIKQIIGPKGKKLRYLENQAGIKPYDIKQKRNEVHIVGRTKEQVDKVKKLLKEIIVSWYFNNIRAHLKMHTILHFKIYCIYNGKSLLFQPCEKHIVSNGLHG